MGLCASGEPKNYETINPYDGDTFLCFRHGQGTYHYSNGDTYKGQWRWNNLHGHGFYTHANGEVWVRLCCFFSNESRLWLNIWWAIMLGQMFHSFISWRLDDFSINVSFVCVRFNGTAKKSETEHFNFELSFCFINRIPFHYQTGRLPVVFMQNLLLTVACPWWIHFA